MSEPDILIVGGGLAGLFCALKLAPLPVAILAAAPIGEGSSSVWAQGGIAAAVSEGDSPELHAADTLAAGAGIVDGDMALSVAREARARVADLLRFGAPFDHDSQGRLAPSQEAAHSARRIVRVKGDGAGAAIMQALIATVKSDAIHQPCIENFVADDLIVQSGRVAGVFARGADGERQAFPARATVLATGGIGGLYAVTTNPPQADGAALAMGARAGARIADAEFVQFHPTAIDIGRDPAPLATEALRGEGATLVNRAGLRFMPALHKDAELAPRDIVARGVFAEIAAGRGAYLDATQAVGAAFAEKFPNVATACLSAGIDPAREKIPIAPAEHYHMGGLWTDARGKTSLPGLWAAGEAASTGLHGANRLASNSLLEAVVFGDRVAERHRKRNLRPPARRRLSPSSPRRASASDGEAAAEVRKIMTRHVGVLRDAAGSRAALRACSPCMTRALATQNLDLRNRTEAALLVAASALRRPREPGRPFPLRFPGSRSGAGAPILHHAGRGFALAQTPLQRRASAHDLARAQSPAGRGGGPRGAGRGFRPRRRHHVAGDHSRLGPRHSRDRGAKKAGRAGRPRPRARNLSTGRSRPALRGLARAMATDSSPAPSWRASKVRPGRCLSAERVALNFLGRLCGIATLTSHYAEAVAHTKAHVCCTRKTTPGLRAFEKYAVRCGGGMNHRFGLDDAILIKDNHIAVAGGVVPALRAAKDFVGHLVKIEIEVDTLDQLREVLAEGADVVLLDNMTPGAIARGGGADRRAHQGGSLGRHPSRRSARSRGNRRGPDLVGRPHPFRADARSRPRHRDR